MGKTDGKKERTKIPTIGPACKSDGKREGNKFMAINFVTLDLSRITKLNFEKGIKL